MGILQKNKNKIKTKIQNIRTVQCEYSSNKKKPIKEKKEKKRKYYLETLTEDTHLRLMIKVSVLFSKKKPKKIQKQNKKIFIPKKNQKLLSIVQFLPKKIKKKKTKMKIRFQIKRRLDQTCRRIDGLDYLYY